MKYLAIDYGTKRIGIAISDDSGTLAFPREIISADAQAVAKIAQIVHDEVVGEIIVGNSLTGEGKENAVMADARAFVEKLKTYVHTEYNDTNIPISFFNEFGTTAAVLSARAHTDGAPRRQASPSARDTKDLDAQAAAMLLQRYLDTR